MNVFDELNNTSATTEEGNATPQGASVDISAIINRISALETKYNELSARIETQATADIKATETETETTETETTETIESED